MKRAQLENILPPLAKESQASYAYRLLELKIVSLALPPGQAVTEAELCEELDMGRTPVREALQRLQQEWLIKVLPRRGIFVTDIDIQGQMRMIEARRSVETHVVQLAASRASTEQRERFRQLAREFAGLVLSRDELAMGLTDGEFNALTFRAADNRFLTSALERMHALARRFWYVQSLRADIFATTAELHSALADAIAEGDPDIAADALKNLLDFAEQYTRASLG